MARPNMAALRPLGPLVFGSTDGLCHLLLQT